jgi:hypothetical protein
LLKRGVRATVLVTERFVELARATYESRDLPDGPMILMPRTEDTEYSERATMERITDETLARFVAAMTSPRGAGSAETR